MEFRCIIYSSILASPVCVGIAAGPTGINAVIWDFEYIN